MSDKGLREWKLSIVPETGGLFSVLSVVLYQLKTWIQEIFYSLLNLALSEPGIPCG